MKKTITKREAAVKAAFAKAIKGDMRAFKILVELMELDPASAAPEAEPALSDADFAAMEHHADWLKVLEKAKVEFAGDEGN